MSFESILGKCEVCRQLTALSDAGRLPHAVVFESSDEKLSRQTALEFAAAALCESDGSRPCGKCSSCRKVRDNIHPDAVSVAASNGRIAVGVGEIRRVISDCYIKPNEARGKVYMIFDKMTPEAQNALLKILEEPPQNVRFVITAEKSTLLLKTVLSRCASFKLTPVKSERDTDKAFAVAVEIARAVPQNIELPLLAATSKLTADRELTRQVLEYLAEFFTLALEQKYIEGSYDDYITEMSRMLKKSSVVKLSDVISRAREMLSHNCNMNLLATWLCANIRESRH